MTQKRLSGGGGAVPSLSVNKQKPKAKQSGRKFGVRKSSFSSQEKGKEEGGSRVLLASTNPEPPTDQYRTLYSSSAPRRPPGHTEISRQISVLSAHGSTRLPRVARGSARNGVFRGTCSPGPIRKGSQKTDPIVRRSRKNLRIGDPGARNENTRSQKSKLPVAPGENPE